MDFEYPYKLYAEYCSKSTIIKYLDSMKLWGYGQ
jgi:hypothetical protein